jgi:hypothetical protein
MAWLVRAIHDLRLAENATAARLTCLQNQVFMGRPDKPGDDDLS